VNPLKKAFLIAKELGPTQAAENLLYRLQLRSGWLKSRTPSNKTSLEYPGGTHMLPSLFSFDWADKRGHTRLYTKLADEVVSGKYRPFGGSAKPLQFTLPQPLTHWTKYGDTLAGKDIKTFWEPARFTWAIPLSIAYRSTKDEKYPAAFWKQFELFIENNPVNQGPNWSSAQEAALRLIPWVMAGLALADAKSSTPERMKRLTLAIWENCCRIPVSLHYARSQHNNHLLSEALGLMLGGLVFQQTQQGEKWLTLGIREFQNGILALIGKDGTFSQHSTNYHRLLLHLALLYRQATIAAGIPIPQAVSERLAATVKWLAGNMDNVSGRAVNLGHNDGTNLLPLGCQEFLDYRPTMQAASRTFLGHACLPQGPWDDLAACLQLSDTYTDLSPISSLATPAIHRIGDEKTWASLRICRFKSRPAHAELLHVEIWNNGKNLAADAGTYAYNLPTPWNNSLSRTLVHNTVTVDAQDQMYRASKFLWLKRVDAQLLSSSDSQITACIRVKGNHAYTHTRQVVKTATNGFEIIDDVELAGNPDSPLPVTIQWLLPDWQWKIKGDSILLKNGKSSLLLQVTAASEGAVSLVRAGECLAGSEMDPIRGWFSGTYLSKSPALSYAVKYAVEKHIQIKSKWTIDRN
jgi:hypothetical protein